MAFFLADTPYLTVTLTSTSLQNFKEIVLAAKQL
jgi:hypothetical protein